MTSTIKVNTITTESGSSITLGESGKTITIPSGATLANSGTATGFASIDWQSTIVTGATHTASANQGLWLDTSSNAINLTLPASPSDGDQLIFADIKRQWGNNAVTLTLNGSKYQGQTSPAPVYNTEGESVHIVYSGATTGWVPINDGAVANEVPQTYSGVSYLVVAGGGGGGYGYTGGYYAAGGGAGGYRNSYASETSGRNSSTESTISLTTGAVYTVTVGDGGAAGVSNGLDGSNGSNSSIVGTGVNIVSIGGGYGMGGNSSAGNAGGNGGSGGGGADGVNYTTATGGTGTAAQGFDGGGITANVAGANGGGGASAQPPDSSTSSYPKTGGAGLASSITGSSVTRAVGGDGGANPPQVQPANTGDGGDGSLNNTVAPSAGAKGVVIMRIPTANYSGTTTGSPTVSTSGSDTLLIFNSTGSVTG